MRFPLGRELHEARARIWAAGRCVPGTWSGGQACSRPAIKRVCAQKGEEPASEVGVLPAPPQRCDQGLRQHLEFLIMYYGQQKMELWKGRETLPYWGSPCTPVKEAASYAEQVHHCPVGDRAGPEL